jgi:hypothetical protein
VVENISYSEAETIMLGRNALYIAEGGLLLLSMMEGPVEAAGSVAGELYDKLVEETIEWTLRLIFEEASSAYAWIPLTIPNNTEFISFDISVNQTGDGDYLSFGIDNVSLFMLEIEHLEQQTSINSGYIDISPYSGENVEFFIGLNSVGEANAKVTIENISFHSLIIGDHDRDRDIDGIDLGTFISSYNSGDVDEDDLKKFADNFGIILE